jgi:hypothetical protein
MAIEARGSAGLQAAARKAERFERLGERAGRRLIRAPSRARFWTDVHKAVQERARGDHERVAAVP